MTIKGIPYAEAPVGDLRWRAPVPSKGWNDTLDGSVVPMMCVQGFPDPETGHDSWIPGNPAMFGEEDCLTLNVYTRGNCELYLENLNNYAKSGPHKT